MCQCCDAQTGGAHPPQKATTKHLQLEDIPELLQKMTEEKGEQIAGATKRMYDLCKVGLVYAAMCKRMTVDKEE